MITALASKTKPIGIPKGYLSLEELSAKYPEFYNDYMRDETANRPMRIWVNTERPVYATICEQVIVKLSPEDAEIRRKLRNEVKFRMAEDRYIEVLVQIPPKEEYEISIRNFVYLWGDPNFRMDLTTRPTDGVDYVKSMPDSKWKTLRTMSLDRFRRNPACQESERYVNNARERVPARYQEDTFDPENTIHKLWGIIPDVYVLPPDSYGYTLKDDDTIEDKIMDALKEAELSETKAVYKDAEIERLKDILVSRGLINENATLTKVRSLIKIAQAGKEEELTPEDES